MRRGDRQMGRIMLIWIFGMRRDPKEGLSTVLCCTQLKIVNITRHMFICYFWSCANVSFSLCQRHHVFPTQMQLWQAAQVCDQQVFLVTRFPIWSYILMFVSVWERWRAHIHAKSWWKRMEVVTAGGRPGRQRICKAYFKGSYCL